MKPVKEGFFYQHLQCTWLITLVQIFCFFHNVLLFHSATCGRHDFLSTMWSLMHTSYWESVWSHAMPFFFIPLIQFVVKQIIYQNNFILIYTIVHQTPYEKSDWSRAFYQFTITCELDMIKISAADIAFIMSSSTFAWLLSPLECSHQKQSGWTLCFGFWRWIMWKMY